jgi:hypothetical protein
MLGSISCLDCFFFKKKRGDASDPDGGTATIEGECRRYPPVLQPHDSEQQQSFEYQETTGKWIGRYTHSVVPWVYPMVWEDDWCGEFRKK